jgi:hypothetical protein
MQSVRDLNQKRAQFNQAFDEAMVTRASKWLPAPENTDRVEYPPVKLSP